MIEIKTDKAEIVLVKIPSDALTITILGNLLFSSASVAVPFIELPEGDYELLGTWPDNMTEEACERVVDQSEHFDTLMEANDVFAFNPVGEAPETYSDDKGSIDYWNEAEARSGRFAVILKK